MDRIFSIIAAISALMVLLSGGGSYWFATSKINDSKQAAVTAKANGLADSFALQLATLQQSINGLAHSPEVISALNSNNPELMISTANRFQPLVPGALKIRLLLPNSTETEQTSIPNLGFGDLEMIHATLKAPQKPVIQGEGEHRHLAFTSVVMDNERIIGVVLASLKADLINQTLTKAHFSDGYAEIKQGELLLASSGSDVLKIGDPVSINLGDSRWTLNFWMADLSDSIDTSLTACIILIPALLACLAFFMGYRKLAEFLLQDQTSILKALKDIVTGKNLGNYPIHLDEMQVIISSMTQFKRVIGQETASPDSGATELADDFFNESFDIDFLEQSAPISTEHLLKQAAAIRMPGSETAELSMPAAFILNQEPQIINDIYRRYDIRGIVDIELSAATVKSIGNAVANEAVELGIKTIVVGRDGRLSSPALAEALIGGICAGGCQVLDIGLVPTPLLYFVAHHSEGKSGIMLTASHNPPEYNGLKIVLNGETLAEQRLQNIKQRIIYGKLNLAETSGGVRKNNQLSNEYIGVISEALHLVRPMKVVLDCGNGAAGELAPVLLKTLGCEVISLYCEIDGHFPHHHPDPSKPENLQDLRKAVLDHAADIGIALDGDGDRIGVIDSQGNIIWPDRQMMLFARDVLADKPGATVIFDVKCSRHLPQQILKYGGKPVMWKSGHSLMKAKLKETGAVLAGEMSGHIFFNDRWFGFDDGLYAAARLIQILSADMRSSADVFAELPDSLNTPELTVSLPDGDSTTLIEQLSNLAVFPDAKIIKIDGLRVEFKDGWGLVRASNTTPAITLRFEADNQTALSRIQTQFKQQIQQFKPELSLPF